MKTTVIHHSADMDGLFCREIARKFLPDAEIIGWDFGDAPLFPMEGQVYILDLPVDRPFGLEFGKLERHPSLQLTASFSDMLNRLVWIDHHKSSIETHPATIPGYRIDGVAACRLAWQWFTALEGPKGDLLPEKQDFINREVDEPYAVRLAGEYDIWDKRDPDAELFQHGLRSRELSESDWRMMLMLDEHMSVGDIEKLVDVGHRNLARPDGTTQNPTVLGLLEGGRVLQFARANEYRDVITQQGFTAQFEGLTFLCCNSHELDIRSNLFEAGIKPEHDALLGFTFNGKDWRVSMYRIPGKDVDILSIAKKYGGGGHLGANGFRTEFNVASLLQPI